MIWALLAVIAVSVVAALLWPLVRETGVAEDAGRELAVLKDQLAELDRDAARGVITAGEAEALKVEVQRRVLSAARRPAATAWREGPGLRAALAAVVAITVPMAAFAVYMNLGSPLLRASAPRAAAEQDMAGLVDQLAERMAREPDNAEGWALLARSYRQMERYDDALAAYRHLVGLDPEGPDAYANYGEMIVTASGGAVTAQARQAFVAALTRDRSEPRSRFYLGLAAAQDGDARGAIAIWRDLTAGAPPDAPWLEMVKGQMFQLAQSAAIMPVNVEPRHPLEGTGAPAAAAPAAVQPATPGDVTAPDISAIQGQFSPENLAQIQAMVGSLAGRLENNPEDVQGWLMLGRSYTVLRNTEGARRAFEKAIALKPNDPQPRLGLMSALLVGADINGSAPLPPTLVTASDDVLKLAPGQPEALFVRGLAAAKAGDGTAARAAWTEARKTASAPLAAEIDRRLKALK